MRKYHILSLLIFITFVLNAQVNRDELPMIGAEVFIEPGQKPEEIEKWFRTLKESGMTLTRIRLTENFLRKGRSWDFSLFDHAYLMGEKYDIKIYGNLFPATPFTNIGGFKLPESAAHLDSISEYIRVVVPHFKQYKSCYGWVPINEPGSGYLPTDAYTQQEYEKWKQHNTIVGVTGYTPADFSKEVYLKEYNSWFLNWLVSEIRKYDTVSPVHVNTHAIFSNVAEYDFPAWRKFLTSLGGSAHASWHFGYFTRSQYAVAMSANSEIIRSGAGNLPWLMTELQGGVNTYSGINPMNPTPEEITQWLWLVLASEAKGAIFWCLNPRSSGKEAGEWALLNYNHEPSQRLLAASRVIQTLTTKPELLKSARVVESGINILYIRESLWNEQWQQPGSAIPERAIGAVMKSALSYYEAFSELGIQSNFKEISEFDFSADNFAGQSIILANQISIPSIYKEKLFHFVRQGGRLFIEGMTGYYDEHGICLLNQHFPYEPLFGGFINEYTVFDNRRSIVINDSHTNLSANFLMGSVRITSGKLFAGSTDQPAGIRNKFERGEVIWIPSLVGLTARIQNDYTSLTEFLTKIFSDQISNSPIRFHQHYPGVIMKTMKTQKTYLSVIINKTKEKQTIRFRKSIQLEPETIFPEGSASLRNGTLQINPEETIVIHWR